MIPKYFRCGDPGQQCPLSVSKDIIKEETDWTCPCTNPNCSDFKEPVGLVEGVSGGRQRLVYAGAGMVLALILLIIFLGGGDPTAGQLKELKARLAPLETKVAELESRPAPPSSEQPASVRISNFKRSTSELVAAARKALQEEDEATITSALVEIRKASERLKTVAQSIDKPISGSGVKAAEAKSLIEKLQALENDGEVALEAAYTKNPSAAQQFDEFLLDVASALTQARKLASGGSPEVSAEADNLKKALTESLSSLDSARDSLATFVPPPPLPFQPADADLTVGASGDLADSLIASLIGGWAEADSVVGPDGRHFIDSASKGKILVEPLSSGEGFKRLAQGDIAAYFADRVPTAAELAHFGEGFTSSRSVAEVIALDAMTLLVHPDTAIDTFEIGRPVPLQLAAGPEGSAIRSRAQFFGLQSANISELSGENAALTDKNLLVLSHYHEEGVNLRAKRLAVKASLEALSLKPSPFTIATEDYRYSFRIVAWTGRKPSTEALSLVKYSTSNPGQEIVAANGFVDLRLRPMQGDVPPEILAALGEALGVDNVSSAVRLSTNFRFEVGKADLERLPRFVAQSFPGYKVVILGFTDSDGGPEINMPLSRDRAEAVAADLRKSKVDTRSGGLGVGFPVDTNETESGKAKNRRAEVWVAKP